MPKERLKQMLEELHAELASTDTVDTDDRALMVTVLDDLKVKLDGDAGEGDEDADEPSITDRLRESMERFEGEHPTLSESVMRVIDQLAKLGI